MALEARLLQKLSQSLLMTPQLQQAIKLLQLGRLEYLEAIEKELMENPLLEELRESGESPAKQETEIIELGDGSNGTGDNNSEDGQVGEAQPKADWEGFLESFTDYQGAATPKGLIDHEERPQAEASTSSQESLSEYLLSQIRFSDASEEVKSSAQLIIGNLDSNGYLATTVEEIVSESGVDRGILEQALELVRSLEPAGVGAKDLRDCLMLQLEYSGFGEGLAYRIVRDHLDKLEKRKLDVISKVEKVSLDEIKSALELIKRLEPHPGRNFSEDTARYVVPDVYVQKVGGDYVLSLNEEGLPKLRVNPYYLTLLKGGDSSDNKEYLQERHKAASWLIKSDLQRRQTILKVAESIVKFQRPFLDHGISRMRPLVLKDVADDIGMHESTVSRVTSNKFIHTPQGVLELKFFFTTGIKTSTGDVSASAIRDRIKTIIAQEDLKKPVSDQEIVDMLKKENVQIARRTVAKYRETLGIEPSSQRKRSF